ncbi:MAG: two-component system response regulator [Marivirga sp.]|nr:two-component system response regulator [Marivirga sp.]
MNTTLKCLLLDDELPGLAYLRLLCEEIPHVEVVKAFNDPLKFLHESKTLIFDLCILDIEMPNMNGLQLAESLKGKPVIFTTGYKEYAAEAFDLEAIDYIRKPIRKERLEKALQKATQRIHESKHPQQFIQVNSNKGKAILDVERICYITTMEHDSRDKRVVLDDANEIVVKNIGFEKILSLLPSHEFCRINKKDIIAIKSVRFFSHDEIHTKIQYDSHLKGVVLPLTENYRATFLEKLKSIQ